MARFHTRYGQLAAGVSALSLLAACSGCFKGAGGGGSSSRLAERSADAGDTWTAAARDLPPVLSVEVQTLP